MLFYYKIKFTHVQSEQIPERGSVVISHSILRIPQSHLIRYMREAVCIPNRFAAILVML